MTLFLSLPPYTSFRFAGGVKYSGYICCLERENISWFILYQHVEGTGIGMEIVKKTIDNSGGKIELESTEDEGFLFKIFFKL